MRLLRTLMVLMTWLLGLPLVIVVAVALAGRGSSGSIDNADWVPPSNVDLCVGGVFFVVALVALAWVTVRLVRWRPSRTRR